MQFIVEPDGQQMRLAPELVVVAGFTGRDSDAVQAHIRELAQQGIPTPATVPSFYSVSPDQASQGGTLIATGEGTSGEAEVALLVDDESIFVTVASDHTDRFAERLDISLSKRVCPKMLAASAWKLDDVIEHWDQIRLLSWLGEDGHDCYQDGSLSSLLPPRQLLDAIPWRVRPRQFVVLCGTVATIGGLRETDCFRAQLSDPVTDRALELEYRVQVRDFFALTASAPKTE